MTNNTFVHWVCILYHLYFWWKKYIENMYIWVHTIYILPLCVPLKRHQTTEVCCALYCSNRTCACSTTKTTTSDLVKLCFAWRQKPVKSVTSSTHFLIKKSYWWETYTQIYCFVRTSWTTSQKYEQMLNNKNHQLWEVLFYWVFWNLENKMYFWWKYLA